MIARVVAMTLQFSLVMENTGTSSDNLRLDGYTGNAGRKFPAESMPDSDGDK